MLTEQQWHDYSRDGFLHLGKVLEAEQVESLKQRADNLALGNVGNPDVQDGGDVWALDRDRLRAGQQPRRDVRTAAKRFLRHLVRRS